MLVAPREVLVCCVLPWSFPARVSCPMLRFGNRRGPRAACVNQNWFHYSTAKLATRVRRCRVILAHENIACPGTRASAAGRPSRAA